jgi:carbonic anhydrase/acetyltransferase-like protein (isoleucine patch superfamily)
MNGRVLTETEIKQLENQGCHCSDWSKITVADPFNAERFCRVNFSGTVSLGTQDGRLELDEGLDRPTGITDSSLHNCVINDNVIISRVSQLANYNIESGAIIDSVGSLIVSGESGFGNGVEIEPLNEGGGRELTLFGRLSSQIAYMMVVYRHRPQFVKALQKLVDNYSSSKKSNQATIGAGTVIRNSRSIKNVSVGESAIIEDVIRLENGTLVSNTEAPTYVGTGVIAKNFIIHSGSKVDEGAVVTNCFIGQGVKIGKQYSAENSVFFANCEGFHGEACSLFAGPYSVTHHKSTLLIAAMTSFYNAGSGTNQSNHMYKLGPLHQGILERGCKGGSFSCMMWPCRVGPFSVVLNKHSANVDTSNLPFSYIDIEGGKTIITPAMNIFTVGTKRDGEKWPARDRRKDPNKLDLIRFEVLSPYVIGKVVKGIADLKALYEKASKKQSTVNYNGGIIKRLILQTCCKYYEIAINIYLGNHLVDIVTNSSKADAITDIKKLVLENKGAKLEDWSDVSGLLAPQKVIDDVIEGVESGKIGSINVLQQALQAVYDDYEKADQRFFATLLGQRLEGDVTTKAIAEMIEKWKVSRLKLNNMILRDASKEFDQSSSIGFGLDGDDLVRQADFEAVRGTMDDNKFITGLNEETAEVESTAATLQDKLLG